MKWLVKGAEGAKVLLGVVSHLYAVRRSCMLCSKFSLIADYWVADAPTHIVLDLQICNTQFVMGPGARHSYGGRRQADLMVY
jgi:hypothetical protein